ncbi:hypothetical protein [Longispora albida]|uniref:hypothetical protein n=1 Tax=Longispora albida TaxID=203523 RepID=UPI0003789B7F|nr:hypothetical protein [Longispora albida]
MSPHDGGGLGRAELLGLLAEAVRAFLVADDPTMVLDDRLITEAGPAGVLGAYWHPSGEPDIDLMQAMAMLRWCRAEVLPALAAAADRREAMRLFTMLYATDPALVPAGVREEVRAAVQEGPWDRDLEPVRAWVREAEALAGCGDSQPGGCPSDPAGLAGAAGLLRRTLAGLTPGRESHQLCQVMLAHCLAVHAELTGRLTDAAEAAQLCRQALAAQQAGAEDVQVRALSVLGQALFFRYLRISTPADLAEAHRVLAEAARLTPGTDQAWPERQARYAAAHLARFELAGDPDDLDEAIAAYRLVLGSRDPDGPEHAMHATYATELGRALRARGSAADLNEAVHLAQDCVRAAPPETGQHGQALISLALALAARYRSAGALGDLDRALKVLPMGLAGLAPGEPGHAAAQVTLVGLWRERFAATGKLSDLDSAIWAGQAAAQLLGEGEAELPSLLHQLAETFRARFALTADPADEREAAGAARRAAGLIVGGAR